MNELQVMNKTLPTIDFNSDEIKCELRKLLMKYEGLVLTTNTVADGKKLLAELRKSQNKVDTFRKSIKKELSKPIKDFEDKCKEISVLFDDVIHGIDTQVKDFENQEKKAKYIEVEKLIDGLKKMNDVDFQIPIKDEYLNKSYSMKRITTDVEKEIEFQKLKLSQHESDVKTIKFMCESNKISSEPYIKLLDVVSLDCVLEHIRIYLDDKNEPPTNSPEITPNKTGMDVFKKSGQAANCITLKIRVDTDNVDDIIKYLDENIIAWRVCNE